MLCRLILALLVFLLCQTANAISKANQTDVPSGQLASFDFLTYLDSVGVPRTPNIEGIARKIEVGRMDAVQLSKDVESIARTQAEAISADFKAGRIDSNEYALRSRSLLWLGKYSDGASDVAKDLSRQAAVAVRADRAFRLARSGSKALVTEIDFDYFLKGRLDPKKLTFKYFVGPRLENGGVAVYPFYKNQLAGYIRASGVGVPHVQMVSLKFDSDGIGSMKHTGLGALLYVIAAKLGFDAWGQAMVSTGDRGGPSSDAVALWQRLRENGLASGEGRFQASGFEKLDGLLAEFKARARRESQDSGRDPKFEDDWHDDAGIQAPKIWIASRNGRKSRSVRQ